MYLFGDVTWHVALDGNQMGGRTGSVTSNPELAEPLSATCEGEHVQASGTTGEATNDDDGRPEFRDVYTGLTLEAPQDRSKASHDLMQCDTGDEHPTNTRWLDHNKRRDNHECKTRFGSRFFVALPCRYWEEEEKEQEEQQQEEEEVLQFSDISRTHPHCKVLRDNVHIEAPKELGLDPSQCLRLGDAGMGHVTQDKPLSSLCETTSESTFSHMERTRRASTDTRHTVVALCARRRLRTLSGPDSKSARGSS